MFSLYCGWFGFDLMGLSTTEGNEAFPLIQQALQRFYRIWILYPRQDSPVDVPIHLKSFDML